MTKLPHKLPPKFRKASHIRVKAKPETRFKGGYFHPSLRCRENTSAYAGEVATVEVRRITGVDWSQLVLIATFAHGREIELGELRDADDFATDDETKGTWYVGLSLGDDIDLLAPAKG